MALLTRVVGIGGKINVKTSDVGAVRIKFGTNTGVTNDVVYSASTTPDGDGWSRLTAPSLSPGLYYYRVAMKTGTATEVLDTETNVGRYRVAPTTATTFSFNFSACSDSLTPAAMTTIANRNDPLFILTGDFWYADALSNDLINYKNEMSGRLVAPAFEQVFSKTNSVYIPSDHDFGMQNNIVGNNNTVCRDNFNATHRQMFPAPLPSNRPLGVYHTFTWGRVRFIIMDTRTSSDAMGKTDGVNKTKLGATQKQWVKDTVTNSAEKVIVLVGDMPWVGPAVASDDSWDAYATERKELADFFTASGKHFMYCHGDMHALAYDDGQSGNHPGNFPIFAAAPLANDSSIKPAAQYYSGGVYPPTDGSAIISQYGRVTFTDTGTNTIRVDYNGYSSDNTLRKTFTKTFTLDDSPPVYDINITPVSATVDNTLNTATLTWDITGTDADLVTGFYAGRSASGTLNAWESSLLGSGVRTQTFTGLVNGETYVLHVDAVIAGGTRVKRGTTTVTLANDGALNIVLTPLTTTVDNVNNTATLEWSLSGSDSGQVTAFTAGRSGYGTQQPWLSGSLGSGVRSQTFTQLQDGGTYTLTVNAIVDTQTRASASAEVTLDNPTGPQWQTIYDGPNLEHIDEVLNANTAYQYRLFAWNDDGSAGPSQVLSVSTPANPTAPEAPSAAPVAPNPGTTSVDISWPAYTGATRYSLYRSSDGSTWPTTPIFDSLGTSFTDTQRTPAAIYYYRYTITNGAGTSLPSPTLTVTMDSISTGTTQPMSAKAALDLMGSVTHQNFGPPSDSDIALYQQVDQVAKWFNTVGYRRMRSGFSNTSSAKEYVNFLRATGATWNVPIFSATGGTTEAEARSKVKWFSDNAPDVVSSFEGLNEPSHYYGSTLDAWMTATVNYQEILMDAVRSHTNLNHTKVLSSAMHQSDAEAALANGQNWWEMLAARGITDFFDVSALHTYGGSQGHPSRKLDERVDRVKAAWPGKPVWVTETGYSDAWGHTTTIGPGKAYGARLALEYALRKIPLYNYELLDDSPAKQTGTQRVFGVVETGTTATEAANPANWSLKFVGQGMKEVLDNWKDPSNQGAYTPVKVKCDITTSGANVKSLLTATKAQSDAGVATLYLWRELDWGATSVSVKVVDKNGERTFNVNAGVTRVDLR
jgi:alkaline phosphatase D